MVWCFFFFLQNKELRFELLKELGQMQIPGFLTTKIRFLGGQVILPEDRENLAELEQPISSCLSMRYNCHLLYIAGKEKRELGNLSVRATDSIMFGFESIVWKKSCNLLTEDLYGQKIGLKSTLNSGLGCSWRDGEIPHPTCLLSTPLCICILKLDQLQSCVLPASLIRACSAVGFSCSTSLIKTQQNKASNVLIECTLLSNSKDVLLCH